MVLVVLPASSNNQITFEHELILQAQPFVYKGCFFVYKEQVPRREVAGIVYRLDL